MTIPGKILIAICFAWLVVVNGIAFTVKGIGAFQSSGHSIEGRVLYFISSALANVVIGSIGLRMTVGSLKKSYRMKHQLCEQCGYDLRASPERCPECGRRHREG